MREQRNGVSSAKRKSSKRFEQINKLVDEISPQLKSPSQVAVLLVCWRHARDSCFQVSTRRIAKSVGLGWRQVTRIMDALELIGILVLVKESEGPIPKRYRITGLMLPPATSTARNERDLHA